MREKKELEENETIPEETKTIEEILLDIGYSRCTAKVFAYILTHREYYAIDIEHETRLRQPEVSITLNRLCKMGYLKIRKMKTKNCRGRPRIKYRLSKARDKVVLDIINEEYDRMERTSVLLQKFQALKYPDVKA
jgi:predicted transcriptional regulator